MQNEFYIKFYQNEDEITVLNVDIELKDNV